MRIRRRIIDYSRGNNLHCFWRLYRLQQKAERGGIVYGIKIGNYVKVGAGAVVSADVPDGYTVVSQPMRMIERKIKD